MSLTKIVKFTAHKAWFEAFYAPFEGEGEHIALLLSFCLSISLPQCVCPSVYLSVYQSAPVHTW